MTIFQHLKKSSFENSIVIMVCILAILRTMVAVFVDLVGPSSIQDLARDFLFIGIFSGLAYLVINNKSLQLARGLFGISLIVLLTWGFITTGNLQGTGKYNALGGLVILIMVYRGWQLWSYTILLFTIQCSILLFPDTFVISTRDWSQNPDIYYLDFWITALGIGAIVFYLRHSYEDHQVELSDVTNQQVETNSKLESQIAELMTNRHELEQLNEGLKSDVDSHSVSLLKQNEAIRDYIDLNTNEIRDPLKTTQQGIQRLKVNGNATQETTELLALLRTSGIELNNTYEIVKEKLINDGTIARKHIR